MTVKREGNSRADQGARRLSVRWEVTALLLITLLAGILRFASFTEIPPGLHYDEGFKGVSARALLESRSPQIFFESDMGEEPIAIYLVALAVALLGQAPWVIRLPSAIVGTLTIPLAWWLGRELMELAWDSPWFKGTKGGRAGGQPSGALRRGRAGIEAQVVGLGTALVLAILYWHVTFSRIGMEPILVPFFATLAFAGLLRGLRLERVQKTAYLSFVLAGLALGGSLYTYKAGYFVPGVAVLFVLVAAVVERGFLRRHWRGLLATALVAGLVAAPLLIYFVSHPANFLQRPGSVVLGGAERAASSTTAVGEEGLGPALVRNLPRVLGMFFWRGDANPRSNLPGRPALDPFLAILFLVGLARSLAGFRCVAFVLPPVWLAVMILPTLITEHAPHFGRAIGATPVLALLCALGGWTLVFGIGNSPRVRARIRHVKPLLAGMVALGLTFSGILTARTYFGVWGQSPDLFYAYDVGLARLSEYMNTVPASQDLYLTPTARDHYTLAYLVRRPFDSFDGRSGLVLPGEGQPATYLVLLREDDVTLPALQSLRPDGRVERAWADDQGRPYAVAYYLPAGGTPPESLPPVPVPATFGDAIRLLGYSVDPETVSPGENLVLTLYWESLAPVEDDYTVFVHLLGEHTPATNGPVSAGDDGQPDGGHYPTSSWRPGQIILDVHAMTVPPETPTGEYPLEAGVYLLATMGRLPASDGGGARLPGDAVLLGAIVVEE
jgi:4-amino-4-deoxy-L-arabinose transferase-like glycosyltransferase